MESCDTIEVPVLMLTLQTKLYEMNCLFAKNMYKNVVREIKKFITKKKYKFFGKKNF